MKVAIEDYYEDIIGKAQSGLGISDSELESRSGVSIEAINAAKFGTFDEAAARALAPVLDLDADNLVEAGEKAWFPEPVEFDGLAGFNTPFPVPGYEEMTVNAFLVWDPDTLVAAVFDTGANVSEMLATIESKRLSVAIVLLTHTHGDHIADLARLVAATGNPPVYVNRKEPIAAARSIDEGETFKAGGLTMEARLTHGHSPGGTTYVVTGLGRTIAIAGDSLFANSMGGSPAGYKQAIENNRTKILSLPEDTIICPGHGPMTTVGEERAHNPFHPEFG